MNNLMKMKISLAITLLAVIGCTAGQFGYNKARNLDDRENLVTQPLIVNDHKYQAAMNYDKEIGKIEIAFLDLNHQPAKIFTSGAAEAILILPSDKYERVSFRNRSPISFASGSHRVRIHRPIRKKFDFIYVQDSDIKNLTEFILEIWLPIDGKTYRLIYDYSEA